MDLLTTELAREDGDPNVRQAAGLAAKNALTAKVLLSFSFEKKRKRKKRKEKERKKKTKEKRKKLKKANLH